MKQADVQEIITEVRNLKTELKEFMSGHTTDLEKQKFIRIVILILDLPTCQQISLKNYTTEDKSTIMIKGI